MNTSLQDELREYAKQLDAASDRRAATRGLQSAGTLIGPAPAGRPHRRRWSISVLALAATVLAVLVATHDRTSTRTPQIGSVSGDDPTTASVEDSVAPNVTASTTDQPSSPTVLTRPLVRGDNGPDVVRLQERLRELHFMPGPADGLYGPETEQAVWAFKALALRVPLANVSSEVTQDIWTIMQQPLTIAPRRTLGAVTHIEIYLPEQVLVVFTDQQAALIAHISSGTGQSYCETVTIDTDENSTPLDTTVRKAVCSTATTPPGVFKVKHSLDGPRQTPIGVMTNPVYFNYGIAIAGADDVPLNASSHGEVRINQTTATQLPSLVHLGDTVYVWGNDGREPEDYSKEESLPSFQYPDSTATTEPPITATQATMPLLAGLLFENAESLLNERGLTADIHYQDVPSGSVNDGRVISQSPQVGEIVTPGTSISLVIASALPAPTTAVPAS